MNNMIECKCNLCLVCKSQSLQRSVRVECLAFTLQSVVTKARNLRVLYQFTLTSVWLNTQWAWSQAKLKIVKTFKQVRYIYRVVVRLKMRIYFCQWHMCVSLYNCVTDKIYFPVGITPCQNITFQSTCLWGTSRAAPRRYWTLFLQNIQHNWQLIVEFWGQAGMISILLRVSSLLLQSRL